MKRLVVFEDEKVSISNVSTSKAYAFRGRKGLYVVAKNVDGDFIWVSLEKTSTPVNTYDTLTEAIKDKLNSGYEVFEYSLAELS